jgi:hypothetical protein
MPLQGGLYTVEVLNDTVNKCAGTSAAYQYTASGINQTAVAAAVKIYPNPSADLVNIESPVPVDVIVTAMDGKTIYSGKAQKQLSMSGWPDGVYQVVIRDQQGRFMIAERLTKISR